METAYHPAAFGCHLLNDDVLEVGVGGMILGSCPQVAPAPWLLSGARVMGEYVGGEQLTYCVQVSVGLRLVEAAYQGLVVLFGRHSACAFPFAEPCNEAIISPKRYLMHHAEGVL